VGGERGESEAGQGVRVRAKQNSRCGQEKEKIQHPAGNQKRRIQEKTD